MKSTWDVKGSIPIIHGSSGRELIVEPDSEEYRLLKAKDAIFQLILQFHRPSKIDDSEYLYMHNYCQTGLELAWEALGIKEDRITLMDFCKLWEYNNRAMWSARHGNDRPFDGCWEADFYYCLFQEKYDRFIKSFEEDND